MQNLPVTAYIAAATPSGLNPIAWARLCLTDYFRGKTRTEAKPRPRRTYRGTD